MPAISRHPCTHPGCDKTFSSPSHLRRHARNHFDDRAYKCTHCGQSFVRREVWKRHEALHLEPQSVRPRIRPIRYANANRTDLSHSPEIAARIPTERHGELHRDVAQQVSLQPVRSSSEVVREVVQHGRVNSIDSEYSHPVPSFVPPDHPPPQVSSHSWVNPHGPLSSQGTAPLPSDVSATFSPVNVQAGPDSDLLPQLGIEGWLDQILTDQAAFPAFLGPPASPYAFPQTQLIWEDQSSSQPGGPSPVDSSACARLGEWLDTEGAKYAPLAVAPSQMARYLNTFWTTVDPQYPIMHRASFDPLSVSTVLLLSIIVLGATATGLAEDWQWAETAFPLAKPLALSASHQKRDSRSRLEMLQTITLLSIAGCGMGPAAQDEAQALISYAMTIARRANLYEDRPRPGSRSGELEAQWVQWILDESTRRIAWLILVRDIEYASFFQQLPSRAKSVFLLPVELPCVEFAWDAPTAETWSSSLTPGETLAAALKRAIQSGPAAVTSRPGSKSDTDSAHLVLMHGLCALGWDVNRRNLIAPEISNSGTGALNAFLLRTFTHSAREDTYPSVRSRKQEYLQQCIQDTSFLAAIDLHLDTCSLQVYAGVLEIGTLQPVRPTDYVEASKAMRRWAGSSHSDEAVTMAASFLSQAIELGRVPTVNRAWAMYIAFLVCWAYYVLTRRSHDFELRHSVRSSKEDALRCCAALEAHARDRDSAGELDPGLIRSLRIQVVLLLATRQEHMVKSACMLVDRNIVP